MITNIESDPRHAGQVQRYHTWPVHRRQSVGEHSWQVLRIMMTVDVGMCTAELMKYVVLHDVGEMVGDVPWPGKRNDPLLKERHDAAEEKIRQEMTARWGQPRLPDLSETERSFFKTCEYLEMWEFGLQEQSMGNRYGKVVAERMLLAACGAMESLPLETQKAVRRYVEFREDQESELEVVNVHDPRHTNHGLDPSDEELQMVEKRQ